MRPRLKIIILFIFLLLWKWSGANTDLIFEHLSTESGLSHGSVSAMLKDRDGFMWFATWDGINRYDGHTFKTFKPENGNETHSASNRVETMKEDSLGNIWIATYDSHAFRWNRLTEKFDRIPNDNVHNKLAIISEIFPTSSGDVWISTNQGVIYQVVTNPMTNQFKVNPFHEKSETPLPGNSFQFLTEDSHKNIWISTNQGVVCLERNHETGSCKIKPFPNTTRQLFAKFSITSCNETNAQLYFGTSAGKLLIFKLQSEKLSEVDIQNQTAITNIANSQNGQLYLGTKGNGVFVFDDKRKQTTHHYLNPNIKNVLRMYTDRNSMLWVESTAAGISKIDLVSSKIRHYQQELDINPDIRNNAQCGLMEDENQTLWMTLKGGGFGFYNHQTDEVEYFYNHPSDRQSKISNFVNCFYKDPSGILWISTYFKGLEKVTFIGNKFNLIQPAPQSNLSITNEVRALLYDSKGYLWAATKKQELFLLDRNFKILKKIDNLNGEKIGLIYALMEDSEHHIYIGTKGNGLFKLTRNGNLNFNALHFTHHPNDSFSISNNNIYTIFQDHKGQIWVGTYGGGINLIKNNQFIHRGNLFKENIGNQGIKVRHIAEDHLGNLWAGTTDGLLRIKSEATNASEYQFQLFNKETGNIEGLLSNDIFYIQTDRNNTLWIASLGGGLGRIDTLNNNDQSLQISTLTKANGLPSDMIFTITPDQQGNLWMSTENGIACYNQQKQIFKNYTQYDGINSGFSESAIAVNSNGNIVFGANNGLYSFDPMDLNNDQKKVNLVFTSFQLLGKELEPSNDSPLKKSITATQAIQLKHDQNVFGITWASLNYKIQDKIQYDYKLEGFDNDWQHVQGQYQANYTKIPPGKYLFIIKFSNPELQQLNEPKTIEIEILPPLWKTTRAYIIYLILIVGLIEMARRIITTMLRLRDKIIIEKELSEIKLTFFTHISHELRTPLTLILGPAKELNDNEKLSEKGKIYAQLIEQNTLRLLRLVNQLLDLRKVQSHKMELSLTHLELVSFITTRCQNFAELAREKNIHLNIESDQPEIWASIDEEKMDSVLFNLLSNAFKFTHEGGYIEISINRFIQDNQISIEVRDNGIGVPKEEESSLFNIFSSHNHSLQANYPGTGIGLALSKEFVQLHQGALNYKPTPGGGATFSILLNDETSLSVQTENSYAKMKTPSFEHAQVPKPLSTDLESQNRYERPLILLVEDHAELRHFIHLQLSDEYQVEEAVNGNDGFEKALNLKPDIILSDVMMPVMDGIQLLEQIKNNFETSHIPVVLLTAKTSIESKIEGLKYGADAYITKPFNDAQLKAQLENLLHQRLLLRKHFAAPLTEIPHSTQSFITVNDSDFLNQIRTIIEENLTNSEFKIEFIYKQMGMGRSKFFDKIKGLTGLSPIDFVKEYRLNKAQNLLQSGQCNVSEASYLSGFTDAGYFSKCYKERFGVSPSLTFKKRITN